jgi:hypothetical protein
MWRDLLDKGKCALGFHIGDWVYVRERGCEQVRICSRCHAETRQTVHTWGAWQYRASDSCEMARTCSRCGEDEHKTEHVWGDAAYESEESCKTVRPCTRCNERTPAGDAHTWQSWSYDAAESCGQTLTCSRCGQKGTKKRVEHHWAEWQQSEFYRSRVRVCGRCGELVFDLDETGNDADRISLQTASHAVATVMRAKDQSELRQRISEHDAVLFSAVTEKYFDFAVDQLASGAEAKESFRQYRELIGRCRNEGIETVFAPAPQTTVSTAESPTPPEATTARLEFDTRLLGHWHSMEILGAGTGFSNTTDTHCVLDQSGRFQWQSQSFTSGLGGRTSQPQSGTWSASDNTLRLVFDNGNQLVRAYQLSGNSMLWPADSRYKLWQRTN